MIKEFEKSSDIEHRTLEERIAEYEEQCKVKEQYQCEEWDTGSPKGNEVL